MSVAAYPIVRIKQRSASLYGELVQQIESRGMGWFRPIVLQLVDAETQESRFLDVGDGPDIICASRQIQPVLDTDWIGLQTEGIGQKQKCTFVEANQHLREFLEGLALNREETTSP
jgi:hypothetical protein